MVINSSKTGVMLAAVIGILGMMATVILLVGLAFSLKRRKSSRDKSRNEGLLQINLPPVNFGLNQGSFVAQVQPDSTNDGTSRSRFEVLKFWKRSGHAPALVEICSTNEGENYRGKICFALSYDNENFALHVEILEAIDLPPLDCISHSSDPYVRVFLLPDRQEVKITRVKRRTLNPKFNETLAFRGGFYSNEQQMMSK